MIFAVGRSSALDAEAERYGDLLQIDIEETYRNLVYKVSLRVSPSSNNSFSYKIESCFIWLTQNIKSIFIAKVDSDTVVHIDRLYNRLKKYMWTERLIL